MNEYSFKQMDRKETETAIGKNFNPDTKYATNSLYYSGLSEPILLVASRPERLLPIQVPQWI